MQNFAWFNNERNQAAKFHNIERTVRLMWPSWKIALAIVGTAAIIVTICTLLVK